MTYEEIKIAVHNARSVGKDTVLVNLDDLELLIKLLNDSKGLIDTKNNRIAYLESISNIKKLDEYI